MGSIMKTSYKRSYHHDIAVDHVCGYEDITDIIREMNELKEDTSLYRYINPTEAEMSEILERASTYTGPWYHTTILFDMDVKVSQKYVTLRTKIFNLPIAQGVNTVTRYPNNSWKIPNLG